MVDNSVNDIMMLFFFFIFFYRAPEQQQCVVGLGIVVDCGDIQIARWRAI